MNKKQLVVVGGVLVIFLTGCATSSSIKGESNVIMALTVEQIRWTKASFKKAEERLALVTAGMTEAEFWGVMKMQVIYVDKKPTAIAMDGFIFSAKQNLENAAVGQITTYPFGYVDANNLLQQKYLVVVKNEKVIEKINLDDYKWDEDEVFIIDLESNPQKDDYLRALEFVKRVKPGMWIGGEVERVMHMVATWSGQNVNRMEVLTSAEGEFFVFGPGYLREKFYQKHNDEELIQHFVFGYEENNSIIPGFIIHAKNLQVTNVEYLQEN